MRERRIADSEIVDCESRAHLLDFAEHPPGALGVLYHHAFGEFQLQQLRLHPAFLQRLGDVLEQVFIGELARRQVDRHAQGRQALPLPGDVLHTGGVQHPFPDRHDEPGFLGERDELDGRHNTEIGMLPAHQRLDARDPLRIEVELRLIMQEELAALQAAAQGRLKRQPLERVDIDLLRVELVIVFAVLFRAVHRDIGVLHQGLFVVPLRRIRADADARRHAAFLPLNRHRLDERGEDLARYGGDLFRLGHFLDQHHELVPAQARHHVARAHRLGEPRPHFLQQLVAGVVAERVVDVLEAVQVDEQHRKIAFIAARILDREIEHIVEHGPVRQ